MIKMITPVRLSSRRETSVRSYHSLTAARLASEKASSGFNGSSIITMLPPRPVRVPPTEVEYRYPRAVVMKSSSAFFLGLRRVFGKMQRYHSDSIIARQSEACLLDKFSE